MTTKEPDFLNYLKTGDMALVGGYDIPKVKGVKLKNLSSADLIGFNYATSPKGHLNKGVVTYVKYRYSVLWWPWIWRRRKIWRWWK